MLKETFQRIEEEEEKSPPSSGNRTHELSVTRLALYLCATTAAQLLVFLTRAGSEAFFPPVANAIKLLQACIYKSVNTGLFLTTSVAISIVKFMLLMLDS